MTVAGPMFAHLVLDAAPLFQSGSVLPAHLSENFYTVPEVVAEVKDTASREALGKLPFEVKVKSPTPEAVRMVHDFAKSTGDIAVLSATDLKVIALAVTLELEFNGQTSKMQKSPRLAKVFHGGATTTTAVQGGAKPQKKKKRGGQEVLSFDEPEEPKEEEQVLEDVETDDDAGEWITPDNIAKFKGTEKTWETVLAGAPKPAACADTSVNVACITTDFAMQNVLLQMRLKLYSPTGTRIKRVKNWLLRCHACYAICKELEKKFCPKCGGPTLMRTSYSVDQQGQMTLYLRSDFQYNNRGTTYSIPMPKGGRNNNNLMLREDQAEYQRGMKTFNRESKKAAKGVSLDVVDDRLSSLFGGMALRVEGQAKAYFDGVSPPLIGYGRRNPNQARRSQK